MNLPTIKELKRFRSPTVTPQALAWDGKQLWLSSRDLGFFYKIDADKSKVVEEVDPPGGDPGEIFQTLWWGGAGFVFGKAPAEKKDRQEVRTNKRPVATSLGLAWRLGGNSRSA